MLEWVLVMCKLAHVQDRLGSCWSFVSLVSVILLVLGDWSLAHFLITSKERSPSTHLLLSILEALTAAWEQREGVVAR